ncbi:hypothetical protein [Bacteroides sp.]
MRIVCICSVFSFLGGETVIIFLITIKIERIIELNECYLLAELNQRIFNSANGYTL